MTAAVAADAVTATGGRVRLDAATGTGDSTAAKATAGVRRDAGAAARRSSTSGGVEEPHWAQAARGRGEVVAQAAVPSASHPSGWGRMSSLARFVSRRSAQHPPSEAPDRRPLAGGEATERGGAEGAQRRASANKGTVTPPPPPLRWEDLNERWNGVTPSSATNLDGGGTSGWDSSSSRFLSCR